MILSYSSEGHKIKSMRQNPNISFTVTEIDSVNQWRSVLAHGTFEELDSADAKFYLHEFAEGVKKIIRRKEAKYPQAISEFSSKLDSEKMPVVYRIVIDEFMGKYREE